MAHNSWSRALAMVATLERGALFRIGSLCRIFAEPVVQHRYESPLNAAENVARRLDELARSPHHNERFLHWGWLGYDALRHNEHLSLPLDQRPPGDTLPLGLVSEHAAVLLLDLNSGHVRTQSTDPSAERELQTLWERSEQRLEESSLELQLSLPIDREAYVAKVLEVQESIRNGDVYLLNLAMRASGTQAVNALQLAHRVFRSHARRAMFVRDGSTTVAAMSMERGLTWDRPRGVLRTSPIKGTRPRGLTMQDDQRLRDALHSSEKERAENIMALDVHRNDLARVSRAGTVQVTDACRVESHRYVHHLVSHVRSVAREAVSAREVILAALPVGSVTGAPKRSAMIRIASLEPTRRGLYTGAYGLIGTRGSMDWTVAIRTLVVNGNELVYGVGGGIVIDSEPAMEWEELQWKLRAVRG